MSLSLKDCIDGFAEQSFKPNQDMRYVLELKQNKDLITYISKLRDVYTCVNIDKINAIVSNDQEN